MSHLETIQDTLTNFYEMFDTFTKSNGGKDDFKDLDEKYKNFLENSHNENNQMVINIIIDVPDHIKVKEKLREIADHPSPPLLLRREYKKTLDFFPIKVIVALIEKLSPSIMIITDRNTRSLLEEHLHTILGKLLENIKKFKNNIINEEYGNIIKNIQQIEKRGDIIRREIRGGSNKKCYSINKFKRNNLNKYLHSIGVDYKKFKNKKLISNFLRTLIIYRGGKLKNKTSLNYLAKYLISYNKNDTVKLIKKKLKLIK